jgi:hypothetical protein
MVAAMLLLSGMALAAVARCDGGTCKGTPGNDKLLGSSKRDIIYAFKGDDKLFGRAARDDLYGFEGRDEVYGQEGNDKLSGADGGDYLNGSSGSDFLNGGNSGDALEGGIGDDEVYGGPDESNDEVFVTGGDGDDLLDGGKGNDTYYFWVSFSHPETGWHATISDSDINPAPGQDVSSGDKLDFELWWKDLTITLSPGPGPEVTDAKGTSTIQWSAPGEFYSVYGGGGDDVMTGDEWPNRLMGSGGSDTINGGGGNDVLYSGIARCCGAADSSGSIGGGDGDDQIMVGSDDAGSGITSQVEGGAGDDNIKALNGSPDNIDCGDGTDTATFDADLDTLTNCES